MNAFWEAKAYFTSKQIRLRLENCRAIYTARVSWQRGGRQKDPPSWGTSRKSSQVHYFLTHQPIFISVVLQVSHAFLPSIPEVLRQLVPSVTSAIGCPILVHPTFRQGLVYCFDYGRFGHWRSECTQIAPSGSKGISRNRWQDGDKQSKFDFSLLSSSCDFVEDLSEDTFQESRSFELEFEIPVVSAPVVHQISVKEKLIKSIQH